MSNRTLIEINHDCLEALGREPDLQQLLRHVISQGATGADKDVLARLDRIGVHVFGTRHHTEPIDAPLRDIKGDLKSW